jgi:hypothetical protein
VKELSPLPAMIDLATKIKINDASYDRKERIIYHQHFFVSFFVLLSKNYTANNMYEDMDIKDLEILD